MVPGAGLEPARHCWRGILSPLCLPIPPPGQKYVKLSILYNEHFVLFLRWYQPHNEINLPIK